jgi:N-acyl-D-aspartate/D-glutamate deacylase
MEWSWETFPEFLDVVATRPLALDVAACGPGMLRCVWSYRDDNS